MVGQQIDGALVAAGIVGRAGAHAVFCRIHSGCDRRPHGIHLCRTDRCQIHRGAGVEQASEIRQPSGGDPRPDVVERCAIQQQDQNVR